MLYEVITAKKTGDNCRADQRLQLLDVKTVDDGPQGEGPGRKGNGGHDVKRDPEPPGVGVIEICGCPQPQHKTGQCGSRTSYNFV